MIWRNIYWGVIWGLRIAGVFLVFVGLEYLVAGPAPLTRLGLTFPRLLATYVALGLAAGAIVGLLRPLNRTFQGSVLLGIVGASVVYGGASTVGFGWPGHWPVSQWIGVAVLALAGGGYVGATWWSRQ